MLSAVMVHGEVGAEESITSFRVWSEKQPSDTSHVHRVVSSLLQYEYPSHNDLHMHRPPSAHHHCRFRSRAGL